MAKYLKLFMVALFATLTFSLTSCGDDDEPNGDVSKSKIIGTWKVNTMHVSDSWNQIDYDRFNEDGSYINVTVVVFEGMEDVVKSTGRWSLDGNKITIDGTVGTIKSISDSKMIVSSPMGDITYTRCSDSEMNKYLN